LKSGQRPNIYRVGCASAHLTALGIKKKHFLPKFHSIKKYDILNIALYCTLHQKQQMKELDEKKTQELLVTIMEWELAGVVRYTHYSLMVTGPNRIPIVQFFKAQATESLLHAQQAGEILTGLEGHPSQKIAPIEETYKHSVKDLLEESLNHEKKALKKYKILLEVVTDSSVYLEEYARTLIGQEELHQVELKKMLRDFS